MNLSKKQHLNLLAEIDFLKMKLSLLTFTEQVLPDLDPPNTFNGLVKGYLFNEYTCQVKESCTSSVYHSYGTNEKTTTKGAKKLYSTRKKALQGLRYAVQLKFAQQLYNIDKEIEQE